MHLYSIDQSCARLGLRPSAVRTAFGDLLAAHAVERDGQTCYPASVVDGLAGLVTPCRADKREWRKGAPPRHGRRRI